MASGETSKGYRFCPLFVESAPEVMMNMGIEKDFNFILNVERFAKAFKLPTSNLQPKSWEDKKWAQTIEVCYKRMTRRAQCGFASHVYAVEFDCDDDSVIKIGMTSKFKNRLSALRCDAARIYGERNCKNISYKKIFGLCFRTDSEAMIFEKWIHHHASQWRIPGKDEWYFESLFLKGLLLIAFCSALEISTENL